MKTNTVNNQINWNSPVKSYNENNQINLQRGSFSSSSSDLSTNQLTNLSIINLPSSDYSFNSSSSSNNSNINSNVNLNINSDNLQLINQITMVNAITSTNQQIVESNEQVYSIDTTKISNNPTISNKNQLPRCLNDDLPTSGLDKNRITKKKGKQSGYKHVPHREKPKHVVEKRNARERKRVQTVNDAFTELRKTIPIENKNKRVSKVKTLKKAIEYIAQLTNILNNSNSSAGFTFKNFKLNNLEIPSSTTKTEDDYEFKLEDDDSESNETFFNNEYFDETSQQSTSTSIKLNEEQINYQTQYQSDLPSDTNNNVVNNQIVNQNLIINNFNDNQINYQNDRNQLPNQLNKENILYQNFPTSNCNTIYNSSYVYQTN